MPEIPLEGHQLCLVPDFFQKSINVFSNLFDFSQVKERLVQPTFLEPGKNNLVVKFTLAQGLVFKKVYNIVNLGSRKSYPSQESLQGEREEKKEEKCRSCRNHHCSDRTGYWLGSCWVSFGWRRHPWQILAGFFLFSCIHRGNVGCFYWKASKIW